MENPKPNSTNVAFKWALISFLVGVIFTYLWQILNIDQTSPIRWISYVTFIAFLLLAQKESRDQTGGFISFGDAFLPGFLYSVFSGILSAIFIYIYFSFLSPQVYQQVLDLQRAGMEAKNMSSDQVDQGMNLMNKYGVIITAVVVLIVTPIMGAVVALIGAAIFKKERSILDIEKEA